MTKDTAILLSLGFFVFDRIQRSKELPAVILVDHLPGGYNAMTVPPIGIFLKRSQVNNTQLFDHEMIHWQQYRDRGTVLFYVDYMLGLLAGYDEHPMEIEARFNENDFARYNYTYAVRNGLANTLYDPTFRQ